ncbi:MAG: putative toxin-antitoxin system toxin component, PIN family [Selenomonadaceae bacterium]|nr:putative toxin-antitoxin system toxin component, PIN family [Selenomonadaceae bacterium]
MRVVLDTNVVISGTFFGGLPRKILDAAMDARFSVCGNQYIVAEYKDTADEMIRRKKGHINTQLLQSFLNEIYMAEPVSTVRICRDPDDDKFINCAIDANAIYIVSGDNDLLTIGQYAGIDIITVRDFFDRFLATHSLRQPLQ